jgi:hypothetical protein
VKPIGQTDRLAEGPGHDEPELEELRERDRSPQPLGFGTLEAVDDEEEVLILRLRVRESGSVDPVPEVAAPAERSRVEGRGEDPVLGHQVQVLGGRLVPVPMETTNPRLAGRRRITGERVVVQVVDVRPLDDVVTGDDPVGGRHLEPADRPEEDLVAQFGEPSGQGLVDPRGAKADELFDGVCARARYVDLHGKTPERPGRSRRPLGERKSGLVQVARSQGNTFYEVRPGCSRHK